MVSVAGSSILGLFFKDPDGVFHIREIARLTDLHPNTVLKEVKKLVNRGFLIRKKTKIAVEVKANRENELFYFHKRLNNIEKLYESGLINYLYDAYNSPEAIILFGSYSRGEDTMRSDIDLAIVTKKSLDLEFGRYEKALKRKIQIFEIKIETTNKNLLTNVANGIVLKGYLNLP
ncbi:nucleotidyltransferase domain-containing protein [Candidatus Woesearchaeota archaeon]|nr:nucleotidyltransferase domain-containing protein [Candidatus Woesearchaeota archaeon]